MNTIDPRSYTLPRSDSFAEEYFSPTVVTSQTDLRPADEKITLNSTTRKTICSSCRYCRHYVHEGRRGGQCEQLNVPVQSRWEACALSQDIFLDDVIPFLFPIVTSESPEHCTAELNSREPLLPCETKVTSSSR